MTVKEKALLAAFAITLGSIPALSGCARHRTRPATTTVVAAPEAEIVVSEAPPRMPQEVVVPAPGPGHVWVPGYWSWQGSWIWVRGAWVIPPHPRAAYVAGHWAHRGHGYVWVSGHWR
jgi:hypothetical protein